MKRQARYPALVAAVMAAIGLPFYLGLSQVPFGQFMAYSGVAGTAMAVGQFADTPKSQRGGFHMLSLELTLWITLIAICGAIAYLLARLF